jgi:large subunit ribosomal protein L19
MQLIEKIEGEQIKQHVPFRVGDSVKVHTRVREGEKERTQIFAGVVIAHKGRGLNETFTVRRISYGEGVERIFPINSPRIEKIEVEREGQVRRAKLFYLRGRKGKEALFVKERVKAALAKKEKASAKRKAKAEKEAASK